MNIAAPTALAIAALSACGPLDTDTGRSIDAAWDSTDAEDVLAATSPAPHTPAWQPAIANSSGYSVPVEILQWQAQAAHRPSHVAPLRPQAISPVGEPLPADPAQLEHLAGGAWNEAAAASMRPGVLMVWNIEHIARSSDDGRTWQPIALQPPFGGVTVDDDGTAVVQHGPTLSFVTLRGEVRDVPAPSLDRSLVAAHRNVVAWLGTEGLFVSRDGGNSFRLTDATGLGNTENDIEIAADGTVFSYSHSEAACGGGMEAVTRVAPRTLTGTDAAPPGLWGLALGAEGLVLGIDEGPDHSLHLAVRGRGASDSTRVALLDDGLFEVATGRGRTLVHAGSRLWSVVARDAVAIDHNVPQSFRLMSVDSVGRAVGLVRGRVVRRDADGVWRVVL